MQCFSFLKQKFFQKLITQIQTMCFILGNKSTHVGKLTVIANDSGVRGLGSRSSQGPRAAFIVPVKLLSVCVHCVALIDNYW